MNNLNFNILNNTDGTSKSRALSPWTISKVVFDGADIEQIESTKNPGETYDVITIKFKSDAGNYNHRVFFPKEGDDERRTWDGPNGTTTFASSFERTMVTLSQIMTVLNPKGFEKMQSMSAKFKTFNDLAKIFVRLINVCGGAETNIKLVGITRDGVVRATFPDVAKINKNGELYVSDNFIGDHLSFTSWEQGKKAEYESAAPTKMNDAEALLDMGKSSNLTTDTSSSDEKEEEIDYDALLKD